MRRSAAVVVGAMLISCGPAPGPDGYAAVPASECASGSLWAAGESESELMNPGQACMTCHVEKGGPSFVVAGTVFSTMNAADDCRGLGGVKVQVTDAMGVVTTLTSNAAGNFFLRRGTFALPYTAKLVLGGGGERAMMAPQRDLDCNTCHTAAGAKKAPGRISPTR